MATPFSQSPDVTRGAALQGIRDRGAPPEAAPAPGGSMPAGPGMVPGGGVPEKFAEITQMIMQTGLTDEVLASFEDFIQFFQQVVQQSAGGAQQAPTQAPPGPGVPVAPAGPGPMGPGPGGPPPGMPVG